MLVWVAWMSRWNATTPTSACSVGLFSSPEKAEEEGQRYHNWRGGKYTYQFCGEHVDDAPPKGSLSSLAEPGTKLWVASVEHRLKFEEDQNETLVNQPKTRVHFVGVFSSPEKAQSLSSELYPGWEVLVEPFVVDEVLDFDATEMREEVLQLFSLLEIPGTVRKFLDQLPVDLCDQEEYEVAVLLRKRIKDPRPEVFVQAVEILAEFNQEQLSFAFDEIVELLLSSRSQDYRLRILLALDQGGMTFSDKIPLLVKIATEGPLSATSGALALLHNLRDHLSKEVRESALSGLTEDSQINARIRWNLLGED